jgi:pentatricopeptide repeat protein
MHEETLTTFERMTAAGVQPDEVTFSVLLSCATKMKSLSATQRIHQHLMAHPTAKRDNVLTGALVHSYAQCGDLESSVSVFEAALRDGVCFDVTGWNCLMSAYTEHGMHEETQATLERMTAAGVQPNEVTFTVLLSCAAKMKSLSATQRIHQHLMAHPTAKRNNVLITALMHSYAQCGDLESSVSVFEAALRDGVQFDVTGWNCLMSAYTEHGMHDKTQATLERMTAAGVQPDEVTFTVLLSCAAKMKSLSATQRIQQHLMAHPTAKRKNVVITALVHSYAQCGDLESSVSVFEAALRDGVRFDVTDRNCVINAYTQHGIHDETQATLERMTAAEDFW